jgi:hypothetical protein
MTDQERITKLETQNELLIKSVDDLRKYVETMLADYHTKVWRLVDMLWKLILILIAVITLFAGLKMTGLIELLLGK